MLCQRGQSVWLHTHLDLKEVVACRVKLFKQIDCTSIDTISETVDERRQVMTEDGLRDADNVQSGVDHHEWEKDSVGAKSLKVINSVSFSDLTIYIVELPLSEHRGPEVKAAKMTKIKNLMDYDDFEEVQDIGQETIGSRWVITWKEKHDEQKQ